MGKNQLDSAAKQRIINHMNVNHKDALALFLEVYCQLSRKEASQSPQLEDLNFSELIIRTYPYGASPTRYLVPIDPPISSAQDARQRCVDMQTHCLQKLGLSDVIVTEYKPPTGVGAFMFFVLLGVMIGFSRRDFFQPDSEVYNTLGLRHAPVIAELCYRYSPFIWTSIVGIHLIEVIYLAGWRLRPHRVPLFSLLAAQWLFSSFVEGVSALRRFDRIIREKEKEGHTAPTFNGEKKNKK